MSGIFTTELIQHGGHRVLVSTESAWHIAVALIFPPPMSAIIVSVGSLLSNILDRGRRWYKLLFNVADSVIAVVLASLVFNMAITSDGPPLLSMTLVAGAIHYIINTNLVNIVVSLSTGQSLRRVWVTASGSVLVHQTAMIFMAALMFFLWRDYPSGLLFMIVPLIAIQMAISHVALLRDRARSYLLPDLNEVQSSEISENPLRLYGIDHGRIMFNGSVIHSHELHSPKSRELLFYLAEHREGATLEKIYDDLWPGDPLTRARSQFHTSVYRLRHATHRDVIVYGTGIYKLNPLELWYDVRHFEETLRASTMNRDLATQIEVLSSAVALYRTDYLPRTYSDWAQNVRLILLQVYLEAACRLARLYLEVGEHEEAQLLALRTLDKDPQEEALYQVLIRVALKSSGPVAGVRWYRRCCDALAEVGLRPSESTRALYQKELLPFL